jgi:hypothetical protein
LKESRFGRFWHFSLRYTVPLLVLLGSRAIGCCASLGAKGYLHTRVCFPDIASTQAHPLIHINHCAGK